MRLMYLILAMILILFLGADGFAAGRCRPIRGLIHRPRPCGVASGPLGSSVQPVAVQSVGTVVPTSSLSPTQVTGGCVGGSCSLTKAATRSR